MRTLVLVLALVLVPTAAAKEGVTATLTSPVPVDARPGTQIQLSWTLATRDGTPFGAIGIFVRLVDARGGPPVDATAAQSNGPFSTTVRVPAGGIAGIRVGLHGTTDIFFPVTNDPFALRRRPRACQSSRASYAARCDRRATAVALRSR
jgi:hypothetical protein